MQAYCLSCRKHTDNVGPRKAKMKNEVVRKNSRCANYMADELKFLKQKPNKKVVETRIILNFSYTSHHKLSSRIVSSVRKIQKM